ncbi:MAG: HU family DNA-binding protein [Paludibacteraceae bacterium]|nr:HU family DNA-binding protein [Paludibacteraceae bacterium]
MNKSELVDAIAAASQLTKADSEKALNAFMDAVKGALKKKDSVALIGFGTFSTTEKAAHEGINPATKAKIQIPAKTVAKFKPSSKILD